MRVAVDLRGVKLMTDADHAVVAIADEGKSDEGKSDESWCARGAARGATVLVSTDRDDSGLVTAERFVTHYRRGARA